MMARPIDRQFPLSPESELLVWCARTVLTDDLKACIRQRVQGSLDWSILGEMAEYHGVIPLLYRNLSTVASDLVPAESLSRLRHKTQVGVLLNRSLAQELITLCETFNARGVPVIPIKGATLAVLAYGDLALRDFTDLDLLVPEASVAQAQAILSTLGYDRRRAEAELSEARHDDGPHQVFVKPRTLCRVDLQWQMVHQHFVFRLDRPEFWRRRLSVMFENHTVSGLAPEDLLIVLCVHGAKHAWEHLKWVCDVAELLRAQPGLDWDRIVRDTSDWRCRRLVYMGLSLARLMLDAPLPEAVLARLKIDTEVQVLAHRMPASLLSDGCDGVWEEQAAALYLSLKDSWWERWRFGLLLCRAHSRVAATPPRWVRWRTTLACLSCVIVPLHGMLKRRLSPAIRGAINRWVAQGG